MRDTLSVSLMKELYKLTPNASTDTHRRCYRSVVNSVRHFFLYPVIYDWGGRERSTAAASEPSPVKGTASVPASSSANTRV